MDDYIDKTIDFYNQHVDSYVQKTSGLQDTGWLKTFISYLPKNAKVLDLGCGFGRDTNFFASHGFTTFGVDLSKKMIEKAKERVPNATFYVMNALKLNFEPNSFDGVWCSATLLHLKKADTTLALKEIKKVLKQNGLFYLNLKEGTEEKFVEDVRYKSAKKFYAYYREDEIKELLSSQDFEVLKYELAQSPNDTYNYTGVIHIISRNK